MNFKRVDQWAAVARIVFEDVVMDNILWDRETAEAWTDDEDEEAAED